MYSEDELLSLSGLQHLAYCERQWALIHLEQQWTENFDTVCGALFHERAHSVGYSSADGVRAERGVHLRSFELGIYGIADIVEYGQGDPDHIIPVEYKVGKPKIESWDRIQVAAQVICLEEMYAVHIDEGALFYGETRHRERVSIEAALRTKVAMMAERMHSLYRGRCTPVVQKSKRCARCSLHEVCVPESFANSVHGYWENEGEELRPLP